MACILPVGSTQPDQSGISGEILMNFRKLIIGSLFLLVFSTAAIVGDAQSTTKTSRAEFARLGVLTRAAYFERAIQNAARSEGVDPNLLWTIAYNETRFRPWLTSNKGAKGLMQFIPGTAARFGLSDPYDAVPAINAAARYVNFLSRMFGGRLDSILAAYNAGEGAVSAFLYGRSLRNGTKIINRDGRMTIGGVPPYTETMGYVGRGLKVYKWLESRNKFPDTAVRAVFPGVISTSIARMQLVDAELGAMPAVVIPKASDLLVSRTSISLRKSKADQEQPREMPPRKGVEVYYDPRSGQRFRYHGEDQSDKTLVSLQDPGPIIVTNDTRNGISNRARTTFAGGLARK